MGSEATGGGAPAAPEVPVKTKRNWSKYRKFTTRTVCLFVWLAIVWCIPATIRALPAAIHAFCEIPDATRNYVVFSFLACALVAGGFWLLIRVIPKRTPKSDIKTEFHSARAAYIAVLAGLGMLVVVAIGEVVARIVLTLRR